MQFDISPTRRPGSAHRPPAPSRAAPQNSPGLAAVGEPSPAAEPHGRGIKIEQLANGMVLLAEPMEWLESVSCCFLLPAGCAYDPSDRLGLSNFTCEMVQRGCGARNSREFTEELDFLGIERSCSISAAHTIFGAAMPHQSLAQGLAIYSDMLQQPHLPAKQLEDGRGVCLQELYSLQDDLPQRVMTALRGACYPDPWGRVSCGNEAAINAISRDELVTFHQQRYQPQGAVLAVAGRFDWESLREQVHRCFDVWAAQPVSEPASGDRGGRYHHLPHASAQTHIAVGFATVPYSHEDYYQARSAVGVLSDGMSSRLFTQVREKEGLAYTVFASLHSLRTAAMVTTYAATSTDRAQQSLDAILTELVRMGEGVTEDELRRLKARIKSSLIMSQESSPSRAMGIAGDWYHLGAVRSLQQIGELVDHVTCETLNAYLANNPPRDFTVVTLGENRLEVNHGVS